MKKGSGRAHHCRFVGVSLACLAIFAFCGVVKAETVITANLTITPAPTVKPGAVLKFQADVIYNPDFERPAGTRMRIFVTRSDFSWVSDKLDIEYPGMGSVHVNFNDGFTIPADAQSGQNFDFCLVYGPWWQLSNIASVKVLFLKRIKTLEKVEKKCFLTLNSISKTSGFPGTTFEMIGVFGNEQGVKMPAINSLNEEGDQDAALTVLFWSNTKLLVKVPSHLHPGPYKVGVYCNDPCKPGAITTYGMVWRDFQVLARIRQPQFKK
ncbi:MAG: hypothetical protein E4H23_07040 [Chrysiogenales bacterium]|nr:MAG: hypothetical protein E4H23_07040 [Chrysiogenales bacterium]